jgi:putative ABC transport system permease protein
VTVKLVFENLKHKPMRSLLSILLIAVPVTLILSLVGLSHGLLEDSQRRAHGVGADLIVRAPNVSGVINFSSAGMDERLVGYIQKQPHVKLALGVINHPIDLPLVITGIDLPRFNQMSGGFSYLAGGPFRGPDNILIDEYYAAQRRLNVGDSLTLLNHKWRVQGIIAGGKLARLVVPLQTIQNLDSAVGKISQVYVKLDNPANAQTALAELQKALPGYKMNTMEEYIAAFNIGNIQGLSQFIGVIMGIGVIIGFAVVCLSMYMAVLQRTREIGILKSLGASKGFILRIILAEALLLGVGGTIIGIGLSFGAYAAIRTLVPASIPMIIVPAWWPIAGAVTLAGTALGALYPGLSAARHDPIEALAYE